MKRSKYRERNIYMADCKLIDACFFFDDMMKEAVPLADYYKNKYCREDYAACARYMVFEALGRDKVPPDLLPSESAWAKEMISNQKTG
ncbi:MAG: hypothetical protein SV487_05865 [Thermodesulfobacteriota bacterium]|nr:hypothetical protein [Thermodesulfobacteriota bacterium]